MIKLIIFDLDGVLIDSRELHYHALNQALEQVHAQYIINKEEHLSLYDGLSTTRKLQLLSNHKGLDSKHYEDRKSTRLNSSHIPLSRMPSSA